MRARSARDRTARAHATPQQQSRYEARHKLRPLSNPSTAPSGPQGRPAGEGLRLTRRRHRRRGGWVGWAAVPAGRSRAARPWYPLCRSPCATARAACVALLVRVRAEPHATQRAPLLRHTRHAPHPRLAPTRVPRTPRAAPHAAAARRPAPSLTHGGAGLSHLRTCRAALCSKRRSRRSSRA